VQASCIARWDGSNWSALGSGLNGWVYSVTPWNGNLVAGGEFGTAGNTPVNFVAMWNGASWSALGGGVDDPVYTVASYGGDLYAGGYFMNAGGQPAVRIARWNGAAWSPLGAGLTGYPYPQADAMTVWNNKLIVTGEFDNAGNVAAANIAAWDGANWSALGGGLTGPTLSGYAWVFIYALGTYNGDLIAAGDFSTADGAVATNGVARWNGTSWSPLGSGVDNLADALAVVGSDLYVGGVFAHAGEKPSVGVARWSDLPADVSEASPVRARGIEIASSPNPFTAKTVLRYELPQAERVRLTIHDANGARIATLVDGLQEAGLQTIEWDGAASGGRRVGPGVYFIDLVTNRMRTGGRIVVVQ
jgi:hypothetical protein